MKELRKEATTTVEWESTPMIDRPTFINGYIVGAEPREKRIEELEKKIRQLQDDIDCLTLACENYREEMEKNLANATELEKENAELKEENQKWKDEWQEQVQKANDEGYARTLQTIQLIKAKELLRKFIETSNPIYFEEDRQKVKVEAEQFLKEVSE